MVSLFLKIAILKEFIYLTATSLSTSPVAIWKAFFPTLGRFSAKCIGMKTVSVRIQVTTIQQGTQFSRLTNNLIKDLRLKRHHFLTQSGAQYTFYSKFVFHVSLCFVISGNECHHTTLPSKLWKKQSSVTIPSLQKGHEGAKKDIELRKGKLECTFVSLYSNILLKFLHRRQLASKGRELNAPAYSPSVKAEGWSIFSVTGWPASIAVWKLGHLFDSTPFQKLNNPFTTT